MPARRTRNGAVAALVLAGGCALPAVAVAAEPAPAPALRLVPAAAAPGTKVTAHAAGCPGHAATGTAPALRSGGFALSGGTEAPDAVGSFRVPGTANPGTYEVVVRCGTGGAETKADLRVGLSGAYGPSGVAAGTAAADTGRGTQLAGGPGPLGRDPVRVACGVGVLAFATVCGTWLLHRRTRGTV
ncbi:hypothetical protein RM574_03245 [Streptomyces sp. DSM 41982]|uniref:Sortase n=1 Tax=Streptomyces evansiae TaxID=3075535 RepID=A0ABD5DZK8_9ACTN|nr:hypothetical protein [Streptomyces sp. DSM 41982]MDT0414492.1 hypothetical protein [Streptomyces sp. DSM 41982]